MGILSKDWWQADVGSGRRQAVPAPQQTPPAVAAGRRWSPGKWVLRAWHLLMLWAFGAGLLGAGGQHQAVVSSFGKTSAAAQGSGIGMVFGLLTVMLIWAVGAWLINSIRRAF